jgi:uncharacterized protein
MTGRPAVASLASIHIYPLKAARGITGPAPWAEDGWDRIRIAAVPFRVAKPCGRCMVTTIDQVTGEVGKQPLKMLGRRRLIGSDLVFGQNLIPEAPGTIGVGDPVEILERAAPAG